ncbi:MAG: hypothetical protein KKH51_14375 [Actinobacteria bacterium]|nr:hypothetical protein [Actinomycetota bacterium]
MTQFWTPENLLTVPVFIASLAVTAIGNFSVSADPVEHPLERLAILGFAHVALFGLLWAAIRARPSTFRGRTRWWALALLVVIAGFARAVLVAALFGGLEIGEPLLWERLTYSVVTPSTLILLLVTARGAIVSHATSARQLVDVHRQLAEGEEFVDRAELDLEPGNVSELRSRLATALSPLYARPTEPKAAADALRSTIDTVVRPVSQGLRRSESEEVTVAEAPVGSPMRIGVGSAFIDALDLRAAWPVLVPVVGMLQGLPAYVNGLGGALGLAAAVVGVLTPIALLSAARFAALRWPGRWSGLLHLPVSGLVAWAAHQAPIALLGLPGSPNTLAATITLFVVSGYLLAFAHSVYSRAESARSALAADNLRLEHLLARRRASVHVRQSSVARMLHGTVQARLTAAYLRLQMAINSGSAHEISTALKTAREDVASALNSVEEQPITRRPVSEVTAELNDTWDELATVALIAPNEAIVRASRDQLTEAVLTELLPELVFNAIKHSNATSIRVDLVWPVERELHLGLDYDHRSAKAPTVPSGLGDRILDEVCLRWSRTFVGATGRTEAVLAWSESPKEHDRVPT